MAITKISFLAQYSVIREEVQVHFVPHRLRGVSEVVNVREDKISQSEFVLGPGPCGKTVDKLDVVYQEHDIIIVQYHTDGTLKEFPYQRRDVLGRLTIEKSIYQ